MSDSLLMADTDDPSVAEAVSRLDGWRVERLPSSPPKDPSEFAGVRLILLYEQSPSALRMWAEYAHALAIPVVAAVDDDAARRRAGNAARLRAGGRQPRSELRRRSKAPL